MNDMANNMASFGLHYLRLVPVTRNWFGRMMRKMIAEPWDELPFRPLLASEPYYSSTEMAIWEREYLVEQLAHPIDAWSFEHLISNRGHWAVHEPVFEQHQIVHKGRWHRRAATQGRAAQRRTGAGEAQ